MERYSLATCVVLVVLTGCLTPARAEERPAVGVWDFNGSLADQSGRGNHAFAASASFAPGHSGQGLRCGEGPAVVPDSPELRPAPGLRLECWAKLDAIGPSWQPLLIKDRAYQLRVDPPTEGGHFSFFLHLDGWEPRVRSAMPATVGEWYHLVAGWDGKQIWLEVNGQRTNGQRTSVRRSGEPAPSREPLELGLFEGVLDEVRIENPNAPPAGVAQWLFEGDLLDSTGRGHSLTGEKAEFVPVPGGQAIKSGPRGLQAASHPDLQVAPGLRIDCSVYFDELPSETRHLVSKDGEYQLRLNTTAEGACFAFFVNLD
ncbi:MAG: LamG domain-containing protein, partial [Patescibacteria group bacterium]|nr:LamG domain-containing protein [Patescibacteria group bacterium]